MNNLKIKRLLATGILSLTLTGCVTPQASAAEMPNNNVIEKQYDFTTDLVHTAKLNKNTAKMKETLMKIFHRVNKTPYVFARDSIRYGWDCSGMVVWMYEQFGLTLPHSATAQAKIGHRLSKDEKPKIGDIVIFGYKGYKNFYHSAIYIGKGKVVNANFGAGTTIIEPLSNYKNSRIAYVRVVPTI